MKTFVKRTAALALTLAVLLSMAACGGSSKSSSYVSTPAAPQSAASSSYNGFYAADEFKTEAAMPMEMPSPEPEAAAGGSLVDPLARPDVKLIYTANMTIQTTEFDESVKGIRDLVAQYGGYFENVYTYNGQYNSNARYNLRNASYTVRVPSSSYSDFIGSIGSGFHVVDQNESVQDIGLQYAETEGHIETLKIKQKRLQELLADAKEMTDIIELENALSNCEYELESYSSTLNRYNSLIGYSTVNLQLSEVVRETDLIIEDPSFGTRIARSFKNACSDFVTGCEDFVIWLIYNMFTIIIIVIVLILVFKFRLLSRLFAPVTGEKAEARRAERRARKEAKKQAKMAAKYGPQDPSTVESPDDNKGE